MRAKRRRVAEGLQVDDRAYSMKQLMIPLTVSAPATVVAFAARVRHSPE
jgi:hypothetical protein